MDWLMTRILILALFITGAISLLVLAVPTLVILGFFLLIIPGLVLSLMPTLFFYLAIFSAVWFSLQRMNPMLAWMGGLGAIGLIGVGAPMLMNLKSESRMVEAAQLDRAPSEKLGRQDVLRIEFPQARSFGAQCDEFCQMLLFNDEARVVVVHPGDGKAAASYRIQSEGCVMSPKELKELGARRIVGWSTNQFAETVNKAVRMRIAGEECLVSSGGGDTASEWTVRWIEEAIGAKPGNWSLLPGEVQTRGVEVRRGNRVVGRETLTNVSLFMLPLHLEPYGSGIDFSGWRWGRKRNPAQDPKLDRLDMLKRLTSLDLDTPRGLDVSLIRKKLDAALDHPEGSGAAFALVGDYYEMLRKEGLEVGDADRLRRVLGDDRVTDFSYLLDFMKRENAVALRLRDALLSRLGRFVKAGDKPNAGRLESIAASLPALAYEHAPLLDELLKEPAERRLYPKLIVRLADRGPESASRFVTLIEESWASKDRGFGWGRDAEAATSGLCLLGGTAKAVLPQLLELHQRYAQGTVTRGHKWRGMLVALGADVNRFESPGSRDQQRYREDLLQEARRCGGKS